MGFIVTAQSLINSHSTPSSLASYHINQLSGLARGGLGKVRAAGLTQQYKYTASIPLQRIAIRLLIYYLLIDIRGLLLSKVLSYWPAY
jgi:hypothetical protein